MKKIFIVSLMLTMVLAAEAQLKVAPKMQQGDEKSYASTTTVNIPGQGSVTITDETTISVAEVLSEGYILSLETTKVKSDAKADNIAGQLIAAAQEMMMGLDIRVKTDMDGQPLSITNYDEVRTKADKKADVLVEQMLKTVPQLGQAVPKETLKAQVLDNLTQENLLLATKKSTFPLALNGKTLSTGSQDEYTSDQGIKMKRMYFVNGQNVTSNGTANMSKDDLKAFIIEQVEKTAPEQAEMVKQNIDQMVSSGMFKLDVKETTSYVIGDDGWVKSIKSESTLDSMGQQTKTDTTVTLK